MNGVREAATDALFDRAREIAATVLAPGAEEVDAEARWPEKSVRALLAGGLGGLTVPPSAGGHGLGLEALGRVCEILGRECASSALSFGMHCVGAAVISAKATPEQVERYLVPIAAGEHLTTLSLSEPGSGAHFYLPQTEMRREGDSLVVQGSKTFVTNGSHADSYVLSVVGAEPGSPPGEFSCVILDGDADGIAWGDPWHGMGMRGNDSRNLSLRNVRLPAGNLLGEAGDEIWYVFTVIAPYFLMAMAGTYVGVAGAAVDEARAHLSTRRYTATGNAPSNSAVVQHRLGTLWATVERARRLVYHAGAAADAGDEDALVLLCSAKADVADAAVQVTNEALTLVGGIGYRESGKLSRLLRDARAAHVMAPTTDMLRTWAGRALLGLPLLAD